MSGPEIIPVDANAPDPDVIARAADIIQSGGLVGMPTETVYGLAGNALDPVAVARIFRAKGRPQQNPLILHVASLRQAREFAAEWPTMAHELASRFWPGPLTLVLRRKAAVPDAITAGLDTFAVRVPDHPVALALIKASYAPLAAPSANRFTEVSPVTAGQVASGLGTAVSLILDAGPTRMGIESTVVDVTGGRAVILRPGALDRERIEAVVGPTTRGSTPRAEHEAHPSPGMAARHYAPKARLRLVAPEEFEAAVRQATMRPPEHGRVGALLCTTPYPNDWTLPFVLALGPDAAAYAAGLYTALHQADEQRCVELLVEMPPEGPAWDAVRDRLQRASHQ